MGAPVIAMCVYRVKPEGEEEFRGLLKRHWPTLVRLGLATEDPPVVYRGLEEGRPFLVEFLTWRDAEAAPAAEQTPEVLALWEPMGALCEERNGRPAMEFPDVERLDLHGGR